MPNHGLICQTCGTEWSLQDLRDMGMSGGTDGGLLCPGCGGDSLGI